MASQECQHPLYFVAVLCRIGENVIVSAAFVIHGFNRLAGGPEFRFKVSRHLDVRNCNPTIFGTVCRAMQNQEGRFDVGRKVTWIAAGVEHRGLHTPYAKDMVHDWSATAGVTKGMRSGRALGSVRAA